MSIIFVYDEREGSGGSEWIKLVKIDCVMRMKRAITIPKLSKRFEKNQG